MNRTRLYAHTTALTAAALTAGACTLAATGHPWTAAYTLLNACVFAWFASRLYADHRRQRADAVQAERAARPDARIEPPRACCEFWTLSEGLDHGRNCSRPAATRRTEMDAAWRELDAVCCLTAWASRGATHDTRHCARKDTRAA